MFWYWIICGILLVLFEFVIPGVVICFFGISALAAGGVVFIFPGIPLAFQLLIFAAGGAVLALLCRKFFKGSVKKRASSAADIDNDDIKGVQCICVQEITPGRPGKVELHGSSWNAVADDTISAGEMCIIEERDNLTLKVRKFECSRMETGN